MIQKNLRILPLVCLILVIVVLGSLYGTRHGLRAGGFSYDSSRDSLKSISETDSSTKQDSIQIRLRIPPRLSEYVSVTIDGVEYVEGTVFLKAEADTTILKEFGFLIQRVTRPRSAKVFCIALWPKEFALDSLPEQILQVRYASVPRKGRPPHRDLQPPKDYPVTTIDGIDYVVGKMLLENEKDTVLLQSFGFRDFWLEGVDSRGAQYMARWPKELPWDSLPPQLKGVLYPDDILKPELNVSVYDEYFPKAQLNVSAESIKATDVPKKEKPQRLIEPPPKNYPSVTFPNGVVYVDGQVVLENDQDTTLLKKFGFRDFYFWGRDSTTVRYMARWPKELPWDSLPPQLKGVVYPFPEGTVQPE
jgi:hypothetical protein